MGKRINHHLYLAFAFLGIAWMSESSYAGTRDCSYNGTTYTVDQFGIYGQNFRARPAEVFCVAASDDNTAMDLCPRNIPRAGSGRTYTAVNPGNPQYSNFFEGVSGNYLNTNTLGFYFCVPADSNNSKRQMCDRAIADGAPDGFEYTWQTVNNDGNCVCRELNNPNNSAVGSCPEPSAAQVRTPDPVTADDGQPDDAQVSTAPATAGSQDATATDARRRFRACVERKALDARNCKNAAEASVRACDSQNAERTTQQDIGDVLGAAGGMYAQANANTGAQSECFKAGLIANGARMALSPTSGTCRDQITSCSSDCGAEKYDEYRNECGQILAEFNSEQSMSDLAQSEPTTDEARLVRENDERILENFTEGNRICQSGRRNQDTMNNLLTGLGNALQQSMICACQLSSSAVSGAAPTTIDQANANGCNAIPNPDDCAANPALPNCNLYDSVNVCTPGAGYNAAACNCQMNPRAAGCPGATAGDGTSNFAGSAIGAARPGDTVSFAGLAGGGGGRGGGIDLSTSEDPEQLALSENNINRAADQLPRAPGGGGAGGGAATSGGAPAEGGLLAEGEPKSGLSGLLTTLTNRAGRFFGARERTNGNIRTKPGSGKGGDPSMARFRPRGLASTGVGTKNMDIWRMMNMCVQGDTCKRNVNNYITGP